MHDSHAHLIFCHLTRAFRSQSALFSTLYFYLINSFTLHSNNKCLTMSKNTPTKVYRPLTNSHDFSDN